MPILGFSETRRDGLMGTSTDQQRRFVGDIFSSGTHLLALINEILDLSKVEAGMMPLSLEPVPIASLLGSSLSIIREKAANGRIRMELDVAASLGSIVAHARQLRQIIYNLLANAVKFMPDGGLVTLRGARVGRAAVGRLSGISSRNFPPPENAFLDFLEIRVIDSGIGIAPEGLACLFEPFSQIDGGLARRFEGTGLGLVLVKRLAELHGGTVADVGQLVNIFDAASGLEDEGLESRGNRSAELEAQGRGAHGQLERSCRSAGAIVFRTSPAA
jgi:signal transduction histidine kinase